MCYHLCRLNAAEMFVDVSREGDGTSTNWVAESGVLDLFLLLGPTPRQVSTDPGCSDTALTCIHNPACQNPLCRTCRHIPQASAHMVYLATASQ